MSLILVIAAGGALGAVSRYLVISWVGHRLGTRFPWGTLLVNVTGSGLLGAFLALTATLWPAPLALRLFVGAGLLGAFTTFSTFAMDVAYLHGQHRNRAALGYILASVALSLAGAGLGYYVTHAMLV